MNSQDSPFMPQEDAASFLHLSPRTLERMRVAGDGPPFLKLGRRVVYSRTDLITWAESRRRLRTGASRRPKAR